MLSCLLFRLCTPFDVYVQKFERYYEHRVTNEIRFGYMPQKYNAWCIWANGVIEVRKQFWDSATDLAKEQVIFHELGHCVLKRQHTKDGIMRAVMWPDWFYGRHRERMIGELFGRD